MLQAKHFSKSPFDNLNKMVTRYYKFWLPEGRKCSWVVLIILFYGGFEIMNMASLHLARWNLEVHAITSQGFIHEFFYLDKFQGWLPKSHTRTWSTTRITSIIVENMSTTSLICMQLSRHDSYSWQFGLISPSWCYCS